MNFQASATKLLPHDVLAYLKRWAAVGSRRSAKAAFEPASLGDSERIPYDQAIRALASMALELYSKPPPTPEEKDDTGLAASTYKPTKNYLDLVEHEGVENVPPETHLQMARMLLLHYKQLGGRLQPVVKGIEQAIRQEAGARGRTTAPEKGSGSLKIFSPEEGSVEHEGTYRWVPRSNKVQINTYINLYKQGFRIKDALAREGLQSRQDYVWVSEQVGRAERLWVEIAPRYIDRVAQAIQDAAPGLARALRANAAIWMARAGETPEERKPQEGASEAVRAATETRPASTPEPKIALEPSLDPREGSIRVREAYRDFKWKWDPTQTHVQISFPFMESGEVSARGRKIPLAALLIQRAGVQAAPGGPPDYFVTINISDIPVLGKAIAEDNRMPDTLATLRKLYVMWSAAAKEIQEQRRAGITDDERRMSLTLARRFVHMMEEGAVPEQVAAQIEEAMPLLHQVKVGTQAVDLGHLGAWKVVKGSVEGKQAIKTEEIEVRLPTRDTAISVAGFFGRNVRSAEGGWRFSIPLKKTPALARKLDQWGFIPLAMSMRIGVLTDESLKSCYELEILSSAHDYGDIGDPKLREQVEMLDHRLHLRATGKDSHGRALVYTPSPYQIIGIAFAQLAGGRVLIADDMGLGKGGRPQDKILTPTGWTTYGQVKVGDQVVGSKGLPVTVTGVYPRGEKEVFKVSFSDGSSTYCDDEHLWAVRTAVQTYRGKPFKAKPLHAIRQRLRDKHSNCQHFIPMVEPVQFRQDEPLPIDPYLLGYIIGNGGLTTHNVHISIPDTETVERLNAILHRDFPEITMVNSNPPYDWRLKGAKRLKDSLISLDLMGSKSIDKQIPHQYGFADVASRIALLQGLLDSDGHAGSGKNIEYSSSSYLLAQQVQQLVWSLGGVAIAGVKYAPKYTYLGETRVGHDNYRLNIVLPPEIAPFQLSRKAANMPPREKYGPCRAIVNVESVGLDQVICIAVDAPDRLYVTDDYIVTHNTVQAIGYLAAENSYPALVVSPASAVWNWVAEFQKWTPGVKTHVVDDENPNVPRRLGPQDVVVLSERRMTMVEESLKDRGFKTMVLDEAHYYKHPTAGRSKAAATIGGQVPNVLLLSGTAMENRVSDLWHLLYILDPTQFPSKKAFTLKYASQNKRAVSYEDPETGELEFREFEDDRATHSLDELRDALRCVMVRRLKSEVLTDLPNKYRKYHILYDLDLSAYHKAEQEMPELLIARAREDRITKAAKKVYAGEDIHEVVARINAEDFENPVRYVIVVLNQLRRLVGEAKAGAAAEWAVNFVQTQRRPLVVFVEHHNVGVVIRNALNKARIRSAYIGGTVPSKTRFEYVQAFQAGDLDVLVCSKAAREAITLVRASDMLFVEWWWVPSWMEQAEDRIYRRGQTSDVTINYLEAPHTTDTYIKDMIEEKRADIERVMRLDDYDESEEETKIEGSIATIMAAEMMKRIDSIKDIAREGVTITVREVNAKLLEMEQDKRRKRKGED